MRVAHIVTCFALLFAAAAAQTAAPPALQPDRKDLLLNALEQQRNDALTKLAFCQADSGGQVAALTAENKRLAAQVDALKAAAAPPVAAK